MLNFFVNICGLSYFIKVNRFFLLVNLNLTLQFLYPWVGLSSTTTIIIKGANRQDSLSKTHGLA